MVLAKIEAFHTEKKHIENHPYQFSVENVCTNNIYMRMTEGWIRKSNIFQKSFESTYLLVRSCSDDFNTIESKPISDGYIDGYETIVYTHPTMREK